jgi:hypothetical protein
MSEQKYPVMLSGPTIAAFGVKRESIAQCVEIRDACRAAIAEHDLRPDGYEKQLTVGGRPVVLSSESSNTRCCLHYVDSGVCERKRVTLAEVIQECLDNPANGRRLRKALRRKGAKMGQVFSGIKERVEKSGPIDVLYTESPVFHDEPMKIVGVDLDDEYVKFAMREKTGKVFTAGCSRKYCQIYGDNGLHISAPMTWTMRLLPTKAEGSGT